MNNSQIQALLEQCDVSESSKQLVIRPRPPEDEKYVNFLPVALRKNASYLSKYLAKNGYKGALIHYSGLKPFQVEAAEPEEITPPLSVEDELRVVAQRGDGDLLLAMEFMKAQQEAGRIICIVGQKSNLCKTANDVLTVERAKRPAPLWTGYDYRKSWRTDFDNPTKLSAEYNDLMGRLERGEEVNDFWYELVRPDDGAIVEYQTTYRLVRNWLGMGEDVRIGYSWPQDYREVVPGDPSRVIA